MYDDEYDALIAKTYDAGYAKMRDPSGDREFYLDLAKRIGGPLLELGCGTGRILLPIAQTGIACTGVDASKAMLDVFRSKKVPENLTIVSGDMRRLDLGRRFRLVTIPFRAFQHMHDVSDQLACLTTVRKHLEPGGTFAFDVFDPKLEILAQGDVVECWSDSFEFEGRTIRRRERISYDRTRQILTLRFAFEGLPGEAEIRMRWFYRYEVEHLLVRAGFRDLQFFGGFDRRPWTAGSETIVCAT